MRWRCDENITRMRQGCDRGRRRGGDGEAMGRGERRSRRVVEIVVVVVVIVVGSERVDSRGIVAEEPRRLRLIRDGRRHRRKAEIRFRFEGSFSHCKIATG